MTNMKSASKALTLFQVKAELIPLACESVREAAFHPFFRTEHAQR